MFRRGPKKGIADIDASAFARSFITLFVPMAILVGSVIAFLYYKESTHLHTTLNQKERHLVDTKKEVLSRYIQAIATDVLTVSKHHELQMLLDSGETRHREELAKEFLEFSGIKKIYDQVRLLDDRGMEILRVNFNNGKPDIVPVQNLQFKGQRYYFKDTFQLSENEIFVSPFDLNIEQGKIEQPLKPMIRFGTPVFDSYGQKKGIVLLNYLGSNLLETLKDVPSKGSGNFLLLNSDGYFLNGMNHDDEWGFMYENKKDLTFAKRCPEAWKKISKTESGQFNSANGVYTFTTIRPFSEAQTTSTGSGEAFTPSEKLLKGPEYHWKIVSHNSPGPLPLNGNRLLARMMLIYAVMLILLTLGSAFFAYASVRRKQAEKEVRKHRDHLKQIIEKRTAELIETNKMLQKDIDKRKQAEEALRESEEKYRSMMEAMDDGVYICSDDFRISYMNSAMIKRVGYDAVGELCYKVVYGLDEKCPWCLSDKVMEGQHVKTEIFNPNDDRAYHVSNSPIFHADGSTSKFTISRDTTELRNIENQLHQAQKMESVGRLAGGVAHDYNNALSVIIGFTEIAADLIEPDSPIKDHLNEVLKASDNAKQITGQLLTFAREQTVIPEVLDLNDAVTHTLKMLRRLIGENIDLIWSPGTNIWPVKIDPSQINQILANLSVNARDAIEGVGKVTIRTENIPIDKSCRNGQVNNAHSDFVLLTVQDNGCGIKREIMDKIFDPFFTTKGADKGTGLGLSTVYGIIKQNKGFIDIKSEPGMGTTFGIYLPRHMGDINEKLKIRTEEIPAGQGETVLLAEDDLSILELGRQILTSLDYTTLTASTPKEALMRAERYGDKIDLLLTDVIMPGMNGGELAKRMKSRYPDIKQVFMSGYTTDVVIKSGVPNEDIRFIQKPFSKKDLAKTVREALDEV